MSVHSYIARSRIAARCIRATSPAPGFMGFDNADTNRDGQLSYDEFTTAWRTYSGQ